MSGLALLTKSVQSVLEYVRNKPVEWDAKVKDIEKKAKASMTLATGPTTDQTVMYYDGSLHSKNSLGAVSSATNPHESAWVHVPNTDSHHSYPKNNVLVQVFLKQSAKSYPGYYEKPEKYKKDWSVSCMQFVYARDASTSEEINKEIDRLGLEPLLHRSGGWWNGVSSVHTTFVPVAGHHPYSRLFVRFINQSVVSGRHPQDIVNFGGNSSFKVDRVVSHNLLKFKKV